MKSDNSSLVTNPLIGNALYPKPRFKKCVMMQNRGFADYSVPKGGFGNEIGTLSFHAMSHECHENKNRNLVKSSIEI